MQLIRQSTILLLSALFSLTTGCVPEDTQPTQEPQFPIPAYALQQINVRELPQVDAQILGRLPQSASVMVGTCGGGWCGVATSEVYGYTEEAYLTDSLPPTQTAQQQTQGRGYWNAAGEWVQSPTWTTDGQPPAGATAKCRDGSFSFSNTRRGTCSWHGGVGKWLPRADSIRR